MTNLSLSNRLSPFTLLFLLVILSSSLYLLTTPYYYFSLLPALGSLFVFAVGKKSLGAFYLLILLIPFQQYTAFAEAYRFLTVSKLVGGLLIVVIGLTVVIRKLNIGLFASNLWPALLVFLLFNLLSTVLSDYPATSLDFLRRLLTQYSFFAIGLYFLGRQEIRSGLPKALIFGISVSAGLSVLGYFFDIPYFAMNVDSATIKRAVGASNDPNYFCMMIVFCLPILVHSYFNLQNKLQRALLGALILLNLTAVVLTYSRSGGLVMAAIVLCLCFEHGKRLRPIYLGFFGVFLLAAVVGTAVTVPGDYWERQKSVTNVKGERSLGRRMSYLQVAAPLFIANPVLGAGPGTFRDHYEISRQAMEFSREGKSDRRAAHNAYIEVAVGSGLLGLVPFIVLVLVALRNFQRANRNFIQQQNLADAALTRSYRLCFVAFLLALLFLSAHFHKFFWLGLVLSQVCLTLSERSATESPRRAEISS